MQILESFSNGLFEVFIDTNTESTWSKFLIVKCGRKSWKYFLGCDVDCYSMISRFIQELVEEIDVMDLSDGIDGVYEFLDSLIDDEYVDNKFMQTYYT